MCFQPNQLQLHSLFFPSLVCWMRLLVFSLISSIKAERLKWKKRELFWNGMAWRRWAPPHNPQLSFLCSTAKKRKLIEKMKGSWGAGSSLLLAGCLRLAAAYNPQQINFTLPQPLQLFSLFLMALQRANKREIELSGLAASLWARWCGASFIPEERGCGTLSFHCFISFHNSIQELPSLFLHSSPLTNQSHAGLLVSFLG